MAEARRRELDSRRDLAAELGRSAVEVAERRFYFNFAGERIEIGRSAPGRTSVSSPIG